MSVHVLLLKPAEPSPLDDMPSRPFHCTVVSHYPVTGTYAHVLVVALSPEDEEANRRSSRSSPFPRGAIVLDGTRYDMEVLSLAEDVSRRPQLAVSVADIPSG